MKPKKSKFWFWARIILALYKVEDRKRTKNPKSLIWENMIMVSGENGQEAYDKAYYLGRKSGQGPRDGVTWNGKTAVWRFLGVSDMGLIHDPLGDGCEVCYREQLSSLKAAKKDVSPKKALMAFLKKDVGLYRSNGCCPEDFFGIYDGWKRWDKVSGK